MSEFNFRTMPNKIKLRELICIYPIEVSLPDGEYFVFVAIDAVSGLAFKPLIEKSDGVQNLLEFIKQLLKDEDFKMRGDQGFTLVLHKYEADVTEIENVIRFHGGHVLIDADLVAKTTAPFIEDFLGVNDTDHEDFDDLGDDDFIETPLSFAEFIRFSPAQDDENLNRFIDLVNNDKAFISSSDPVELAKYLYKKLDPILTLTFQKAFLMYGSIVQNNHIPAKYLETQKAMLEGLNHILTLQDNDPEYPFADQLNPKRKKH